MAAVTPEMCRVTIVTPNRWADVALPADEPLAEMLPALLDHVGDPDLEADAVVLQRLSRPPLDGARSLAANGVVDGETLYLNAQNDALPEVEFDDLVDGIATGMERLDHRWAPAHTRHLLLSLALGPVLVAGAVLVGPAPSAGLSAAMLGEIALLLVLAAAASSRAWGDRAVALITGALAMLFGATSAAFAVAAVADAELLSGPTVLAAATTAFCVASIVDMAIGGISVGFAGAAFGAILAALGALATVVADWGARQGLALTLVLAVVVGEIMVATAARLAGVVLPPLPRNAVELEEAREPVPGQDVLDLAARVDSYLTALLWGSTTVIVVCAGRLAWYGGWAALLVAAASVASLLRMRVMPGRAQRIAVVVAGIAGPSVLLLAFALAAGRTNWVVVSQLCVALAALFVVLARTLPGRRTIPHFGRAAELLEGLVAASLLPLLLAVLGTYTAARNLR